MCIEIQSEKPFEKTLECFYIHDTGLLCALGEAPEWKDSQNVGLDQATASSPPCLPYVN
jgi:hypothetical protein